MRKTYLEWAIFRLKIEKTTYSRNINQKEIGS